MKLLYESELFQQACFLAHQVCEKLLKGEIQEQKEHPPRTHDLFRLKKLSGIDKNDLDEDLKFLSSLYIETRYPADFAIFPTGAPDKEDTKRAIDTATPLMDIFKEKYGL
jgi:HEPN domain-containing protein